MKKLNRKLKLNKQDHKDILTDIITLRELSKKIWGNAIYIPDDFDMDIRAWEWHLGKIVLAKDPKKTLETHLKDATEKI